MFLRAIGLDDEGVRVTSTSMFGFGVVFGSPICFGFFGSSMGAGAVLFVSGGVTSEGLHGVLGATSAMVFFLLFFLFLSGGIEFYRCHGLSRQMFGTLLYVTVGRRSLTQASLPIVVLSVGNYRSLFLGVLYRPLNPYTKAKGRHSPMSLFLVLVGVFCRGFGAIIVDTS